MSTKELNVRTSIKNIRIEGRHVTLSVGGNPDHAVDELAWLLQVITNIVAKEGRIFDTIEMKWDR